MFLLDSRLEDLLVAATAAWERGLDPSNLNRFQELYRACDLFDQIVAVEPQRTDWLEARGQVGHWCIMSSPSSHF